MLTLVFISVPRNPWLVLLSFYPFLFLVFFLFPKICHEVKQIIKVFLSLPLSIYLSISFSLDICDHLLYILSTCIYVNFTNYEFIYHTYLLLKFYSSTLLQPKSNSYRKRNAVVLLEKDANVLSNQNTWYNFFDSFAY